MTKTFILDAWAILAFLQKESPADGRVRAVLEKAGAGSLRALMSVINLGEVYYRVGKIHGKQAADETLASLCLLPIEVLSADDETVFEAARLKMQYPISYADAFAAQVAIRQKGCLLTGDPELIALKDVFEIEILHRQRT